MKKILFTTLCMFLTLHLLANGIENKTMDKEIIKVNKLQDPPTLPVGTIIQLKSSKDIYAKNFKAGDHFFVDLS
jgi:hypothetical protein